MRKIIEDAWEERASLSPSTAPRALREAVDAVIAGLDAGRLRVAEKAGGEWITHQWIKKAVLLSFRLAENRRLYGEKFRAVLPRLGKEAPMPQGGFYVWLRTPIDDAEFVRRLYQEANVLGLPGSFLGRESRGKNPGANHVRIALVAPRDECVEAIGRIMQFAKSL